MDILKTIIVEDEETSRAILRNYLEKYCPKVEIIGEAGDVDEALPLIRNNELDLVFLDVEMPRGNAFDLLDQVGDRSFETVFVTAYNQYAIEALNTHASYYILKPVAIDELIKAVDYVAEIKKKEKEAMAEMKQEEKMETKSEKVQEKPVEDLGTKTRRPIGWWRAVVHAAYISRPRGLSAVGNRLWFPYM